MKCAKAWSIASATVFLTCLVVWVVLNLSLGNKQVDSTFQSLYAVEDPQFVRSMGATLARALTQGNAVDELVNGEQIFPAMLAAIRSAKRTITFETYIYWSGSVGKEFSQLLAERARSGVKVHVLLDWIGGQLDESLLEHMQAHGVEIRRYNAPGWYNLHRLNNRTHRKLLVVDGTVGFIGGVGIADAWRGSAQDPWHWRDTHFRAVGPVVTQMQAAFTDNWLQSTGEVLHGDDYFPAASSKGTASAHVFTSAPGGGSENMQLMYLMSITAAARSIDLAASYFLPDDVSVDAFVAALQRGVRVRIVLPGPHMDQPLVRRASRALWGKLLLAGAQIHEYQPTMFHCKLLVVDGLWVSVGSTNFDNRSFSINDETNMNVYDAAFAARQVAIFERDLKNSRQVMYADWERRPMTDQVLDSLASLLRSQL
jgi:cardiolipin synthase